MELAVKTRDVLPIIVDLCTGPIGRTTKLATCKLIVLSFISSTQSSKSYASVRPDATNGASVHIRADAVKRKRTRNQD